MLDMVSGKATQRKRKPLSRLRYEDSHPTVSFRMERGLWNELRTHLSQRGISRSEFIKEAMGAQKALIEDTEEARLQAYESGYKKGKLQGERDAKRALDNEKSKLKEEKEQVVKEARHDGYKEGFEMGRVEEKKRSQRTLDDERSRLRAETGEALKKAEDQGRKEGHSEGYAQGKETYLVSYACAFCGEPIEVTSQKEKTAIRQLARERGWAHEDCWAREEQRRQREEAQRLREEARRREFEARYGTRATERGFDSVTGQG